MSIEEEIKNSKQGHFWLKYKQKIILAFGMILIAAVSFEAGYLEGQKNKQESVIVNKAACPPDGEACAPCPKNETASSDSNNTAAASSDSQSASQSTAKNQIPTENQTCAFVASKNSNKYHLSTCRYAQNIKPENKVCFSSKEEAESRGYEAAKCCIK